MTAQRVWVLVLLPSCEGAGPLVVSWAGPRPPAELVVVDPDPRLPCTVFVRRVSMPGDLAVYTVSPSLTFAHHQGAADPTTRPVVVGVVAHTDAEVRAYAVAVEHAADRARTVAAETAARFRPPGG